MGPSVPLTTALASLKRTLLWHSNRLPEALPPNTITLGFRVSTNGFGEGGRTNIRPQQGIPGVESGFLVPQSRTEPLQQAAEANCEVSSA